MQLGGLPQENRLLWRDRHPSGERFRCWIDHPVLRSGLRSALGMGPAEGYQTRSQVLSWGVGTEVLSRACMSEAGGQSGCGAGWPSLVGWFPTGHHGCGSGLHCCAGDPFCPMVRCMGICPVRETPRASLATLSPYPGKPKKGLKQEESNLEFA